MRISDWRSDVCSSDLERFAVESASLPDPFFRGAWWPDCPQRRSRPDLVARREEPPCDQRQGQVQRGEQAAAQRQRGLRLPDKAGPKTIDGIEHGIEDRKSTRLNSITNAHLVCRLLLEKKKTATT